MNREIKFRVWDNRKMSYWYNILSHGEHNILKLSNLVEKDDHQLMQFTGLKDKNGNDIYEGDIVKVKRCHTYGIEKSKGVISVELKEDGEEIGVIFWSISFRYSVSFEHLRYDDSEDLMPAGHRYEIIGNIFENPELLT